ncbi:MAG: cation:proton antiporter [Bdellovibrionales bacterium]
MESHASGLLATLVISLVAAFAGGLAVRIVKLPPLLGYLLAGMLLGPFAPGFIANQSMASDLAEIGVALLLFNVGLHFSLQDLMAVRRIALFGAVSQMLASGACGYFISWFFFGHSPVVSLIMGVSFSVASTAISSRLLEEKHQFSTLAGRIAVGWLVVQDIAAILAMVIIPVLINQESATSGSLIPVIGKTFLQVTGFAAVMLFVARKYIPQLLGYVARVGSRELFTLAVIVVALGIAYGSAVLFGVSIALGAFFAGVVIGESDLNHHAAAEALSLQQIFAILFFVSVGMLFDFSSILRMPGEIVALWGVIVLGMGGSTFLLLIGLRVPAQAAALVGGLFAQAGELSFILSQMGYKWGVLSLDDRDLIMAVALVSIVANPFIAGLYSKLGTWAAGTKLILRWQKYGEVVLPEIQQPPVGHVILIGHGRVGQRVAEALKKNKLPYIVIESDRRLMEKLRRGGTPIIFGDATRELVLTVAHPESAKLLIITSPQSAQMRQIVALAKHLNPSLEILVRVHEEAEARNMARYGVTLAVMGEREIAVGLAARALQYYELPPNVVLETLEELRQ